MYNYYGITSKTIEKELEEKNVEIRAPISEMYAANELAIEAAKKYALKNKLAPKNIILIVPNNNLKEFARKELGPDFDEVKILTPYEIFVNKLNVRNLVDEDQKFLAAYSSLPKSMEENAKVEVAKEMVDVLDRLIQQQINLEVLENASFESEFIKFVKENNIYLYNSYMHRLDETDAKEFLEKFRTFITNYRALKKDGYVDFSDLIGEIGPKDFGEGKVVIALNISDLTPLQQNAIVNLAKQSKKIYTYSPDSFYAFAGADPSHKEMGTGKITYYTDVTIFQIPSINKTQKVEGILANDLAYAAASKAKELGGSTEVIVPYNSMVWEVSKELDRRGVSYTAYLTIFTDTNIKESFINFVTGLLEKDDNKKGKGIILNAMYNPFSPIPLNEVLQHKDEFLAGRNVEAFKPFYELREKAKNIEGLKEVLQEAVKRFESISKDAVKIKTANAMLERLKKYDINYPIDLISWLKATEVSESYAYSSSETPSIVVGTPQKVIGHVYFPTAIYVISKPREGMNITEALFETAMKFSKKNIKQANVENTLTNEKIIFVAKDKSAFPKEVKTIEEIKGQTEKATTPSAREIGEYIRNYLKNLTVISYSFLSSVDNYLDFYKEILGIKETSRLIEIGEQVHEALEQGKNPDEVDPLISKFVENAYTLLRELRNSGYVDIGKEINLSVPFTKFAETLGININMQLKEVRGRIDLVMKKEDKYLILDYKTGQTTFFDKEKYFEQLAFYKLLLSISQGIDESKIEVRIMHIGLRRPFEESNEAKAKMVKMTQQDYEDALEGICRKLKKLNYYYTNPKELTQKIELALAKRS